MSLLVRMHWDYQMNTDAPVWRTWNRVPCAQIMEVLCRCGWEDKEVCLDKVRGHVGGLSVEFPIAKPEAHIVGLRRDRDHVQKQCEFEEPETIPECSLE